MTHFSPYLPDLKRHYGFMPGVGKKQTDVDGVTLFWSTESMACTPLVYNAGLVFILQGRKTGYLGGETFTYDASTYLSLSVPVPFECESMATPEEPVFGLFVSLDIADLRELVVEMKTPCNGACTEKALGRGVVPIPFDDAMRDTVCRLLTCLTSPLDCRVLGKSILRELMYRALTGPNGKSLYELTRHDEHYARVSKALNVIHRDYARTMTVDELASEASMSASAFHRAFKQVTASSPVQYIKKVRLDKARDLIMFERMRAGVAANQVGYESPSQFSRDFKRHFGIAPSDAKAPVEMHIS
ncbi:MAG: AraC family transcriptional regulator [Alphaproteobacteria bacterium]